MTEKKELKSFEHCQRRHEASDGAGTIGIGENLNVGGVVFFIARAGSNHPLLLLLRIFCFLFFHFFR